MAAAMPRRWTAWRQQWLTWWRREHPDRPVDVEDPLGGALRDAELLVAFAAQSRRSIDPKKLLALAEAAAKVVALRNARQPVTPALGTDYWAAYDALAVEMDPLSAHSIRASMRVNRMRAPRSLLTPTALYAVLAVMVFYVFLSLQSFWVAGKEMVERADALEQEKSVLAKELASVQNALDQAGKRHFSRWRDRCEAAGGCGTGNAPVKPPRSADSGVLATLDAELRLLQDAMEEKQRKLRDLQEQRGTLAARSRPLEELMSTWYAKATGVCSTRLLPGLDVRPMAFICSLKVLANPTLAGQGLAPHVAKRARAQELEDEEARRRDARINELTALELAQRAVSAAGTATSAAAGAAAGAGRPRDAAGGPTSGRAGVIWPGMLSEAEQMRSDRQRQASQQAADAEADNFSRVTTEVRMIVANLGTYLIALVMGLLGALTYMLRTLSQQLRDHTYVPVSASEGVVRICLGAIAGVFGTLLVSNSGADPAMKSLPPIFVPFIFGYGIEILFTMLDRLVQSFSSSGQAQAGRS